MVPGTTTGRVVLQYALTTVGDVPVQWTDAAYSVNGDRDRTLSFRLRPLRGLS